MITFLLFLCCLKACCVVGITNSPENIRESMINDCTDCVNLENGLAYFDGNNQNLLYRSLLAIEAKALQNGFDNNPWDAEMNRWKNNSHHVVFFPNFACRQSFLPEYNYTLTYMDHTWPVMLVKTSPCKYLGAGNNLGFFYEAISFALSNGIALGRIINPTDPHCPPDTMGSLMESLPRLIVPFTQFHSHNTAKHHHIPCKHIPKWPWMTETSHTWQHIEEISVINNYFLSRFMFKMKMQNSIFYSERLTLLANYTQHAFIVHFRCTDALMHAPMGLLPLTFYDKVFNSTWNLTNRDYFHRIVIVTDTTYHGRNGHICTIALAQLQSRLLALSASTDKSRFFSPDHHQGGNITNSKIPVEIAIQSQHPTLAFLSLHLGKMVICGLSTFCLYAALGSQQAIIATGPRLVIEPPKSMMQKIEGILQFVDTNTLLPLKNSTEQFLKIIAST